MLKKWLDQEGISGRELARRLNISNARVSLWNTGHRRIQRDDIAALVSALAITDEDLPAFLDAIGHPADSLVERGRELLDLGRRGQGEAA